MEVYTVSESFIAWLENTGIGATFGTNLYLGQVPDNAPDTCFWTITSGEIQSARMGLAKRLSNTLSPFIIGLHRPKR